MTRAVYSNIGQFLAVELSSSARITHEGPIRCGKNLFWRYVQSNSSWPLALRMHAAEAVAPKPWSSFPPASRPISPPRPNWLRRGIDWKCAAWPSPASPDFELDDREMRRTGPSYTIHTARQLRQDGWTDVAWLIGADMLNTLPTWHEADALLREVRFIVMARPGMNFAWSSLPPAFRALRKNVVQVPQIDISGTEIRRRVSAGLPIDYFCPPAVCRYIADHKLYQTPAKS